MRMLSGFVTGFVLSLDEPCCALLDASLEALNARFCPKLQGELAPLGRCPLKKLDLAQCVLVSGSVTALDLDTLEALCVEGTGVTGVGELKQRRRTNVRISGHRNSQGATAW